MAIKHNSRNKKDNFNYINLSNDTRKRLDEADQGNRSKRKNKRVHIVND